MRLAVYITVEAGSRELFTLCESMTQDSQKFNTNRYLQTCTCTKVSSFCPYTEKRAIFLQSCLHVAALINIMVQINICCNIAPIRKQKNNLCLCFFFWWEMWAFLLCMNLSLSFTNCWLADLFTMRSADRKQAGFKPHSKWSTFGWIHAGSDDVEHENIVTVTKHEAFWSMTATAAGPTLFPFQKSIFQLLFWNVDGWLGWRAHYQDWAQTGMYQNCQKHEYVMVFNVSLWC